MVIRALWVFTSVSRSK